MANGVKLQANRQIQKARRHSWNLHERSGQTRGSRFSKKGSAGSSFCHRNLLLVSLGLPAFAVCLIPANRVSSQEEEHTFATLKNSLACYASAVKSFAAKPRSHALAAFVKKFHYHET